MSWLKNFDTDFEKSAFVSRAKKTVDDIKNKFTLCSNDGITSEAGEYIVSVLSKDALTQELNYLNIPLPELLGKKKSGNPGFDFHSENMITDTVIFGEAKYIAASSAYSSALSQINDFVEEGKDIEDLPELKPFCTTTSLSAAIAGRKGFAVAFSAKKTSSDVLIKKISVRDDFKSLLCHSEIILLAVNI